MKTVHMMHKGTINVISSRSPFLEWYVRSTTVSSKRCEYDMLHLFMNLDEFIKV